MSKFQQLLDKISSKVDVKELAVIGGKQEIYNPFRNITLDEIKELVHAALQEDPTRTRSIGSLMGLASGDAMGAPLEFEPCSEHNPVRFRIPAEHKERSFWEILTFKSDSTKAGLYWDKPYNAFQLKPGQWTDDSSMALCIADSLIFKQTYDGSDIRTRFFNWYAHGYNNSFFYDDARYSKFSVGLGGNIKKSLVNCKLNEIPTPIFHPPEPSNDSGNGSLMRLAPIPIFYQKNIDDAVKFAELQSLTTHPGSLATKACGFYSFLIVKALQLPFPTPEGVTIQSLIDSAISEFLGKCALNTDPETMQLIALLQSSSSIDSREAVWDWKHQPLHITNTLKYRGSSYNGHPVSAGYFGSFCMDALAIALHCSYYTNSFDESIAKAVNFCGDCDTTAAIVGQLTGAFYGYHSISPLIIESIEKWDHGSIALRGILLSNII
ncbi:hypothetical protein HDV06_000302 [Boothiomyces sp. JEL0866]|nr:hypothetical protein HDV06_000302 [Boothiomyces sp. JEL0866]